MDLITSTSNPLFKLIVKLEKNREREKSKQFVVEGIRELVLAKKSGHAIERIICNQRWSEEALRSFVLELDNPPLTHFSNEIFEKVSYRDSVPNVLGLCTLETKGLVQLKLQPNALVLILESVEKPGNIGAIFRTADAAGVDAIILANPNGSVLNPNTIRASLGSLFTVPHASGTNLEVNAWIKANDFKVVITWLEATNSHYSANYSGNTAIVMGSEAQGISAFWKQLDAQFVKIPMRGEVDSMNVSTATAVVVYEAIRQRLS